MLKPECDLVTLLEAGPVNLAYEPSHAVGRRILAPALGTLVLALARQVAFQADALLPGGRRHRQAVRWIAAIA